MQFHTRNWVIFLVLGQWALATESVTPEERKAEFAKPRGFSSSSSSQSGSSTSGGMTPSSPANTLANDVYKKMGDSFEKEMTKLTKDFSLPKAQEEPNYLSELEKARKSLDSAKDQTGSSKASLLAQYTEVFIATLNELTKMQIEYENSQIKQVLRSTTPSKITANQNHLNPSPISIRTPISSPTNNGRGLFPSELDALSTNAYNPPK